MPRQWDHRGYGQWSVIEKATGELIGELFEREDADPVHGEPAHVYSMVRPPA